MPDIETLWASQEDRLFELHANLCKVFTDPKRLQIMGLLGERERSVNELALELGARASTVSQHLALMRLHGVVRARREGTTIFYALTYPEILDACRIIHGILIKRLGEAGDLAEHPTPQSMLA